MAASSIYTIRCNRTGEHDSMAHSTVTRSLCEFCQSDATPLLCCVCHDTNAVGNDGAMLSPDRFVCTGCVRRLVDAHG